MLFKSSPIYTLKNSYSQLVLTVLLTCTHLFKVPVLTSSPLKSAEELLGHQSRVTSNSPWPGSSYPSPSLLLALFRRWLSGWCLSAWFFFCWISNKQSRGSGYRRLLPGSGSEEQLQMGNDIRELVGLQQPGRLGLLTWSRQPTASKSSRTSCVLALGLCTIGWDLPPMEEGGHLSL